MKKTVSELLTGEVKNYLIVNGDDIVSNLEEDFQDLTITYLEKPLREGLSEVQDDAYLYNIEEREKTLQIEVLANKVYLPPLHIFYVQKDAELIQHTSILLHENSELKYFEYITNETEGSINFVSDVTLKENAKLEYAGISKVDARSVLSVTRNASIYRYGRAEYSVAEINDATTISNTNIFLREPYAEGTSKTVAITSLQQEASFRQLIEHLAKDTEGYIENYGVSNNQSTLVFEGVGKINKDMKRSKARQQNRGIVLGDKSRLDANPLLLIDEYDVEASHGAAIGRIDEEQLYYLMSRGLTLTNATRLIINGFLSPVIEKLSDDVLIEDFMYTVEQKTM